MIGFSGASAPHRNAADQPGIEDTPRRGDLGYQRADMNRFTQIPHSDQSSIPRRNHRSIGEIARQAILRGRRESVLLSLALQGGGSFGAFTWGVLDRLLEEDCLAIDAISGTSAGAVNAVVLAAGLAEGGPDGARVRLERVWKRLSNAAGFVPFNSRSPLSNGNAAIASVGLDVFTRVLSPYQLNPLGLNPLRDILSDEVDFERLRTVAPVRLLVAATRVRDGRLRKFHEKEIALDAVLASTCLPLLNHAVLIEGEFYWDGAYAANPVLVDLVTTSDATDILLVQIASRNEDGAPLTFAPHIVKRLQQIVFNSPLLKELEMLDSLKELAEMKGFFSTRVRRKLRRVQLHRIDAEEAFDEGLEQASALNLDWSFLTRLRDSGRAAAGVWLSRTAR
jgi:NTE family protein